LITEVNLLKRGRCFFYQYLEVGGKENADFKHISIETEMYRKVMPM